MGRRNFWQFMNKDIERESNPIDRFVAGLETVIAIPIISMVFVYLIGDLAVSRRSLFGREGAAALLCAVILAIAFHAWWRVKHHPERQERWKRSVRATPYTAALGALVGLGVVFAAYEDQLPSRADMQVPVKSASEICHEVLSYDKGPSMAECLRVEGKCEPKAGSSSPLQVSLCVDAALKDAQAGVHPASTGPTGASRRGAIPASGHLPAALARPGATP